MSAAVTRASSLAAAVRTEQAAGQITDKEAQERIWLIAATANLSATTDEIVDLNDMDAPAAFFDRFYEKETAPADLEAVKAMLVDALTNAAQCPSLVSLLSDDTLEITSTVRDTETHFNADKLAATVAGWFANNR